MNPEGPAGGAETWVESKPKTISPGFGQAEAIDIDRQGGLHSPDSSGDGVLTRRDPTGRNPASQQVITTMLVHCPDPIAIRKG